jgi:hypothetical protein
MQDLAQPAYESPAWPGSAGLGTVRPGKRPWSARGIPAWGKLRPSRDRTRPAQAHESAEEAQPGGEAGSPAGEEVSAHAGALLVQAGHGMAAHPGRRSGPAGGGGWPARPGEARPAQQGKRRALLLRGSPAGPAGTLAAQPGLEHRPGQISRPT